MHAELWIDLARSMRSSGPGHSDGTLRAAAFGSPLAPPTHRMESSSGVPGCPNGIFCDCEFEGLDPADGCALIANGVAAPEPEPETLDTFAPQGLPIHLDLDVSFEAGAIELESPMKDQRACKACQRAKCSCSLTAAEPSAPGAKCTRCERLGIACEPNAPRKRACTGCRKAKERCRWGDDPNTCLRCARLGQPCIWPRSKQQAKRPATARPAAHSGHVPSLDIASLQQHGPAGPDIEDILASTGQQPPAGAQASPRLMPSPSPRRSKHRGTCEACKRAKSACDGHGPGGEPCSRCRRLSIPCVWSAGRSRAQQLACDACRRRKVACRRPREGEPCARCVAQGLVCKTTVDGAASASPRGAVGVQKTRSTGVDPSPRNHKQPRLQAGGPVRFSPQNLAADAAPPGVMQRFSHLQNTMDSDMLLEGLNGPPSPTPPPPAAPPAFSDASSGAAFSDASSGAAFSAAAASGSDFAGAGAASEAAAWSAEEARNGRLQSLNGGHLPAQAAPASGAVAMQPWDDGMLFGASGIMHTSGAAAAPAPGDDSDSLSFTPSDEWWTSDVGGVLDDPMTIKEEPSQAMAGGGLGVRSSSSDLDPFAGAAARPTAVAPPDMPASHDTL